MSRTKAAIFAVLCLAASAAAAQEVTCDNNPMRAVPYCSSAAVHTSTGYYFFGTDDTGTKGRVLFSFDDQTRAYRPETIMVKIGGGAPYKIQASPIRPDVNCRYGCDWRVGATAEFSESDLQAMSAASSMLVSFVEGAYISDPIEVDPQRIARWYAEWSAAQGK